MPKQHYSPAAVHTAKERLTEMTPAHSHLYILIQATAPEGISHRVAVYAVTPSNATDYHGELALCDLTNALCKVRNQSRGTSNYGRNFTLRCLRENIGECVIRAITKQTGVSPADLSYSYL